MIPLSYGIILITGLGCQYYTELKELAETGTILEMLEMHDAIHKLCE